MTTINNLGRPPYWMVKKIDIARQRGGRTMSKKPKPQSASVSIEPGSLLDCPNWRKLLFLPEREQRQVIRKIRNWSRRKYRRRWEVV